MASITKMSALAAFAVLSMVLSIPQTETRALDDDDPLASPDEVSEYQPEPDIIFPSDNTDFPGFSSKNKVIDFLKNCEKIADMDLDCGLDFHLAVFYKDARPAERCCQQILKPGKQCHDVLVKYIFKYEGIEFNLNEVSRRSDSVWKHCSLVGKL